MNKLESKEDYLERILMLSQKNGSVRSIDIAHDMGFSKPSVSVAMKKLREGGFITVDKEGLISLTEEGRKIAEKTYERHKVIKSILISIGVSDSIAEDDACKIEHELSDETFAKIREVYNNGKHRN
ncbi:MAG: metal-dependent transcriptional regulator [Erysipelotrichaceae bacterium]|jgi:Mn-dependent DtxR family transcriptional regulator|nr:metal-dependent transcriptional regulator [Erysipelotrichaceae bacterium]